MYSFKLAGAAALSLAVAVKAQANGIYWVDPESVDLPTKQVWCSDQTSTCPLLCLQYEENSMATNDNSCDPELLTYSCECSNGLQPNMTEYSLTLPYHMCKEWTENCVAGCYQGNNICQSECREKHPCGARDPTRVNVTDTATTSSAPKATFTNEDGELEEEDVEEIQTGFGDEEEAAEEEEGDEEVQEGAQQDRPEGAGVALTAGSTYGVAVVAGSMLAAFGLFL